MSERSLARLVQKETGLSFGRWRQQLHLLVALRLRRRRNGAAGLGRSWLRVGERVHHHVQEGPGMPPARYFAALEG